VEKDRAKRLRRAGYGVTAGLLLLLAGIVRGLQGPYAEPVLRFGLALVVLALLGMVFLLIRLHMILSSAHKLDKVGPYKDWFGSFGDDKESSEYPSSEGDHSGSSNQPSAPKPGRLERLRRRLWRREG
jgi:hypothetical protein